MLRSIVAMLAIALASVMSASADMKSLVSDLRSQPLTMFDWGLHLLEEELQRVRISDSDFLRVSYDPKAERLIVNAVFLIDPSEVEAITAARACYTRLHAIKLLFGIIDTDRIHLAPAADFRLGSKFSRRDSDDYPELPDAAKVGAELLKSIYIRASVGIDPDEYPFNLIEACEGKLLDQEVTYRSGAKLADVSKPN
jgi:hypothetical protein